MSDEQVERHTLILQTMYRRPKLFPVLWLALGDDWEEKFEGVTNDRYDRTYLACVATYAGPGNFIDIGTRNGGSAIVVAMIKKRYSIPGHVYTIDPLDGFYKDHPHFTNRAKWDKWPTTSVEKVEKNIAAFGLDDMITIVQSKSHPWPEELRYTPCSLAFIDGDHWGIMPLVDWLNVRDRSSKYVLFHDNNARHPTIQDTVKFAETDPRWTLKETFATSALMKRVSL